MVALTVDLIDPQDGVIYVRHTFFGETEEMCEDNKRAHAEHCEYFSAAIRDGRTIEELEELDDSEWPATGDEEEDED